MIVATRDRTTTLRSKLLDHQADTTVAMREQGLSPIYEFPRHVHRGAGAYSRAEIHLGCACVLQAPP